jgi:DUF4097 and DUF4098 domain-containing protein YvlB
MKVFSKLLMLTLILSVFVGCEKDEDENLPLANVAATYEGTILIKELDSLKIDSVSINIGYTSGDSISLTIAEGTISVLPIEIKASCKITSDKEKYSFSGNVTVPIPADSTNVEIIPLPIKIEDSTIDKAGKAAINMAVTFPVVLLPPKMQGKEEQQPLPATIKFEGKKKNK